MFSSQPPPSLLPHSHMAHHYTGRGLQQEASHPTVDVSRSSNPIGIPICAFSSKKAIPPQPPQLKICLRGLSANLYSSCTAGSIFWTEVLKKYWLQFQILLLRQHWFRGSLDLSFDLAIRSHFRYFGTSSILNWTQLSSLSISLSLLFPSLNNIIIITDYHRPFFFFWSLCRKRFCY